MVTCNARRDIHGEYVHIHQCHNKACRPYVRWKLNIDGIRIETEEAKELGKGAHSGVLPWDSGVLSWDGRSADYPCHSIVKQADCKADVRPGSSDSKADVGSTSSKAHAGGDKNEVPPIP